VKLTVSILCTLGLCTTLGCSSLSEDVCDEHCNCEPCSDRDYEDCVIRTDAQLDIYDSYDCGTAADDLYACAIDRGYCRDDHWTYGDACERESEDLQWCVGSASLLRGNDVPRPN
jgi:hypothetical protein